MEEKKIHCRQLMDWFGPISLAVGCIDEETFSEHGIKLDYNEDGIAVQKTATLTCEGQQRAKHLSNIQTRYARQMISYERVFEQYTKICKTKQDETNLLTRGVEAEQKILMCIGLVLNKPTPTLDDMTLTTLGERGGKRNGITYPKNVDLVDFIRARHPRTVTETTGAIHYYSKPTGKKRDFLCDQCLKYKNTPHLEPVVVLPPEPARPVNPRNPQPTVDTDNEDETMTYGTTEGTANGDGGGDGDADTEMEATV